MPITLRNASVGKRSANSVTKSHPPVGGDVLDESPAELAHHAARPRPSRCGENHGLRIRRYLMWSGASICVGTNR